MARLSVFFAVLLIVSLAGLPSLASGLPPERDAREPTIWSGAHYQAAGDQNFSFLRNLVPKPCKFCGAILASYTSAGKGRRTPEGFDVCETCNKAAVRDLRAAQALVSKVRAELVGLGLKLPWGTIPIQLKRPDAPGSWAYTGAARGGPGAATVYSLSIKFLPGLPTSIFKGVAAHELTHAWAYLHGSPLNQDIVLSEGAPSLVEYIYLERDTSALAKGRREALLGNNNPAYGGGLRRLKTYAEKHQLRGVLNVLKSSRTIPKGF